MFNIKQPAFFKPTANKEGCRQPFKGKMTTLLQGRKALRTLLSNSVLITSLNKQ